MSPPGINDRAIVLFAHGSRETDWVRPFERLRDRVARELGGEAVGLAYLEHAQPPLDLNHYDLDPSVFLSLYTFFGNMLINYFLNVNNRYF